MVLGIGLNSVILLLLLLTGIPRSDDVGKPFYMKKNKSAMVLVTNLCLVDLVSIIIISIIVPDLVSKSATDRESCAIISFGFCFINFSITLSTFILGFERWFKISRLQTNMR